MPEFQQEMHSFSEGSFEDMDAISVSGEKSFVDQDNRSGSGEESFVDQRIRSGTGEESFVDQDIRSGSGEESLVDEDAGSGSLEEGSLDEDVGPYEPLGAIASTRQFRCMEPACTKVYRKQSALNQHLFSHGDLKCWFEGCQNFRGKYANTSNLAKHWKR